MRAMLEGVVLEGTGKRARLDGYTAAGKTGTAQKIDPATGRYSATQLIASFVGMAPINNPAVTILVQLDSPVGAHEGGSVAAPVFKRVAEQVLAYRNVPHDVALPAGTLHAARIAEPASDADEIADFDPKQVEAPGSAASSGEAWPAKDAQYTQNGNDGKLAKDAKDLVSSASDAPGAPRERPSLPAVGLAEGKTVSVPSLAGKTVREVIEICMKLGVSPVLVGSGVVQDQQPGAGTLLRRGGALTVRFGRTPGVTQAQLRKEIK
jgi:cell division protein FtsI (penicillin-binding protein 3)